MAKLFSPGLCKGFFAIFKLLQRHMVEYDGIFVKLTKMQLIFENSDVFVKLTEFRYSLTKKIPCFVVNPLHILFNYRYLSNNLRILGSPKG